MSKHKTALGKCRAKYLKGAKNPQAAMKKAGKECAPLLIAAIKRKYGLK